MDSECQFFKTLIETIDEESQSFENLPLVSRAERGIQGPKRKNKQQTKKIDAVQLPSLPSKMDWNHIRIFYYVATSQSFTRAAKYLKMTQPTLSRAVQQLEQELGEKLLIRGSHLLSLTHAGEIVLATAAQSFKQIESLKNRFAHDREGI